jgi:predicted DsbA family dithiol-disulfide isomerase
MGEAIRFDVYFDYLCPYSYEAAALLRRVATAGLEFGVHWRYFSLTQVNNVEPGWTIWDAPLDSPARGRLAFQAAESARRQGRFDDFHWRLLAARHEDGESLEDERTIQAVGAAAGLDLEQLKRDVEDRDVLAALKRDHLDAVERHHVFGTPTFVFDDAGAAYVRLRPAPDGEEATRVFRQLCEIIPGQGYLRELKRPSAAR